MSPFRRRLYRNRGWAVILAGAALFAGQSRAQLAPKKDVGPRALALLELLPGGSSRLIPVSIMYEGNFYDASVYKASPVPMALDDGTVYEAFRSGKSLGLFTVTGALQGKNIWIGKGNWEPGGPKPAAKKEVAASKPVGEEDEGPPVLRRPGV